MEHRKLTIKEQRFVEEYTGGKSKFVQKHSAIIAGYSKASAHAIAGQLLQKPHIKAAIEKRLNKMSERCAVNVENLTQKLDDAYELAMGSTVERGDGKSVAMSNPSASAAVAAVMGIAKLHGLVIDKKAETTPDGKPLPPAEVRVVLVGTNNRSTDT